MADDRFPLFRLPFLALCRILDFYGTNEIVQLSLCSKLSLRVAKKCWKKKGHPTVNLLFHEAAFFLQFDILEAHDHQDQQWVGDTVVPGSCWGNVTITFWKDNIFGIEQIVGCIKELFDVPITKIELGSEDYEDEFIDTMDCIMKVQESVQDCTLDISGPSHAFLTHLLDNCKITGNLKIYGKLSTQFSHNWNIHMNGLYISESSCITFQNLMNINCKHLQLNNSNLTSEDMNQFLKHWQNGGNSRIEYASIEMKSINHPIIKSGIDIVPQPGKLFRFYSFMSNKVELKRGGLKIQRNDGTTGGCFFNKYSFEFGVDPFEFEVDPFDFRLDPFEFGIDPFEFGDF